MNPDKVPPVDVPGTGGTPASPVRRLPARAVAIGVALWRTNRALVLIAGATALSAGLIGFLVIAPRYTDPSTRMFSSKLGAASVYRKVGRPFPVSWETVDRRTMVTRYQGEGLVATEPVQVQIAAMARILKVHARPGDRVTKGQLLVELDSRRAQVKMEAANSALKTAVSERERTAIGSAYIMANERPELEQVRLDLAKQLAKVRGQLVDIEKQLATRSAASNRELLLSQAELLSALAQLSQQEWAQKTAEAGRKESVAIADNNIEEARLACRFRKLELEDYAVHAPCDGLIERCVIHEGEYNQDPGKPAFLINRGIWFEARMDQTTAGRIATGDAAAVYLEAFPNQVLRGRVSRVIPTVSYDAGGPEATRPVRPLGSGAPEWPSTYAARVELDSTTLPLMPGLTGFVRIDARREVLAVPVGALLARSGRSALVYVIDGDRYRSCKVVLGSIAGGWAEVVHGLEAGAQVLTEGHQVLEPGDKVALTASDGQTLVLADGDSTPGK